MDPDRGATGSATVTVPSGLANLRVSIRSQGLANVTAAHIHVGRLGENGPVAMSLFDARTQTWSDDYNITADASRLNTNTVPNVRALFQAIRENRAYINVHTQANPGGAIRGQLGRA